LLLSLSVVLTHRLETLLELGALIGIQYRHDFLPLCAHAFATLVAIGDGLILSAVLLSN